MNNFYIHDDPNEYVEEPRIQSGISRRGFVQILGAGILITVTGNQVFPQGPIRGSRQGNLLSQRLHIGTDGIITVLTGKIEMGQGARTQISMASAEELRVPVSRIRLVMGDTQLTPDDGGTAGSRTTPSTIPAVRTACASAQEALIDIAAEILKADRSSLIAIDGKIVDRAGGQEITYAQLAESENYNKTLNTEVDRTVSVTPVSEWKVMGTSVSKIGGKEFVTGAHRFPSDIARPDMLYGKVLWPASYGAELVSIDTVPAEAIEGVTVVRDGDFTGVVAQSSHQAETAVKELEKTAKWTTPPHPPSAEIFTYLKERSSTGGGIPEAVRSALNTTEKTLSESYTVAYIQHTPLEPRAAVAEWNDGNVTVWTGTQQPRRVHSQVARELQVPEENVRIILPDMGSGFGGKHSGEVSVQAARLARAAGRPVSVRWTREEEFTWAYFRPAGHIEVQAGIDKSGSITAWDFVNYNSGSSAVATPYDISNADARFIRSETPVRQGSYRALAATANNFARESFMDELASAAGADPLEFRLKHLTNERIRNVLKGAAEKFGWADRTGRKYENRGIGLSCGTEKGSVVAACAEVEVDRKTGAVTVLEFCEAFECGKIINPENTRSQVMGCIIMGMGAALWEEIRFENGKVLNPSFRTYRVPRFGDIPRLDIHLLDRPDLDSVGAGETPIIAIAPAIANAVFNATGIRVRSMPLSADILKTG